MSDEDWWMDDPTADYSQANEKLFKNRVNARHLANAALEEMSQEGGHNSTTSTLRQGQSHRASHVSQDPLDFNNASPRAHTAGAVERSNPFYDGRVVPSQPGWPSQHSNRSEERPPSTARFDLSVSQHNSAIQAPQTLRPKRVVDFQAFDDTELPSAAPLPTTTFVPAATMGMGRPPQFAIPSPPSMMVPSLQPTEVLLSKSYHNTHLTLSQPPSTEEAAYTLQQQHKDQIQLRPGESIFTMLALRGLLAPNHPHFPFNIPTTLPAAAQAILDRHRPDLQHLDTKPLYRRLRLKDDDDVEQKWNGSLPGPAMLRQSDRPTPVLLDDAEQDRRLQESQLRGVTSSGGDASAAVAQGTTSRFAELAKQLQRDIPKINGQSIIELSRSHAHSLLFPPPRVLEARQRHQDTLTTSDRVISFQNIPPPAVSYIQPAAVVQHRSAFSASAEQLIRVDPLGRPPTTNSSLLPEPRLLPQQDHSHGYALPASTNLVSHAHPFAPQLPSSSATPIATTTIHPQALSASHYVPLEVVAAPPSQPPPPPIHGGVFMPSSSHCGLPRTYVNSSLETPPPLPATSALVIPAAAPSSPIPTTVPLTTTTTGINEETYTLTKSELLEYCRTFVQQIIQQQQQQQHQQPNPSELRLPESNHLVAPVGAPTSQLTDMGLNFAPLKEATMNVGSLPYAPTEAPPGVQTGATPAVHTTLVDPIVTTEHGDARAAAIARLKSKHAAAAVADSLHASSGTSNAQAFTGIPLATAASSSAETMRQQAMERLLSRLKEDQAAQPGLSEVGAHDMPSPSPRAPSCQY